MKSARQDESHRALTDDEDTASETSGDQDLNLEPQTW